MIPSGDPIVLVLHRHPPHHVHHIEHAQTSQRALAFLQPVDIYPGSVISNVLDNISNVHHHILLP